MVNLLVGGICERIPEKTTGTNSKGIYEVISEKKTPNCVPDEFTGEIPLTLSRKICEEIFEELVEKSC